MKKIVLIDDKASIAKVLGVYLNNEFEMIYFEDPLKVIEWLEAGNEPDLIISDIHMPHMEGDEFLLYIKQNQLYQHIPVVILSSEDSTSKRIQLLEQGSADCILKPFNPMELKVRIKRFL